MRSSPQTPPAETFLYTRPSVKPTDALRVAWIYPADYSIAMSSLGFLTLYRQMDCLPFVHVERLNMSDLTHARADQYDLIGFSFSFELDILNMLRALDQLGIPLLTTDRNNGLPLIFAGGPVVMTNPEPYAAFFDCFLIGEGETLLTNFLKACTKTQQIIEREERKIQLAQQVPGVYIPSGYEVSYQSPDGPIARIEPKDPRLPPIIEKQLATDLDAVITASPILSEAAIFSNTFLVEVMRGCAHRCRFCLASYSMLPARGPSLEPIQEAIAFGLQYTHKLGLLGVLIADHPDFEGLCMFLQHHMKQNPDIQVSAASLRGDTLTPTIAQTLKQGKQNHITIAVESGSEKLRRRINKNLKQDEILQAAAVTAAAGIKTLKLYGMIGLPDETEEDVFALADLVKTIRKANPRLKVDLGCSSFVPKAATPFQWQPRLPIKTLETRQQGLRKQLLKIADLKPNSVKWDQVQAVLSRGDRRLTPVLLRYTELGGSLGAFNRAYKECFEDGHPLPSADWYGLRERPEEEILPWEHLFLGVSKAILYKEGLPPKTLTPAK